eukprot:m.57371 g.57371  ORF g.57371 m.57371 type:complete len:452 (-) comp13076_c0_seq1:1275-2630(-)
MEGLLSRQRPHKQILVGHKEKQQNKIVHEVEPMAILFLLKPKKKKQERAQLPLNVILLVCSREIIVIIALLIRDQTLLSENGKPDADNGITHLERERLLVWVSLDDSLDDGTTFGFLNNLKSHALSSFSQPGLGSQVCETCWHIANDGQLLNGSAEKHLGKLSSTTLALFRAFLDFLVHALKSKLKKVKTTLALFHDDVVELDTSHIVHASKILSLLAAFLEGLFLQFALVLAGIATLVSLLGLGLLGFLFLGLLLLLALKLGLVLVMSGNLLFQLDLASQLIGFVGILGLHGREQEHLLDVVVIGEEHGHAIQSHAPTSCGWKTVLKGLDKHLVYNLSLLITHGLVLGLLLEALALNLWVVQLCVSIAHLLSAHKELETLCQTRDRSVPFGQWAHNLWVIDDKCGVNGLGLQVLANELIRKTSSSAWRSAVNTKLNTQVIQPLAGLIRIK